MLPGPVKVARSFVEKLSTKTPDGNTLFGHIGASLKVVLIGYIIGVAAGIPSGVLMAWYQPVDDMVRPVLIFCVPYRGWHGYRWSRYGWGLA